MESKKVVIIVRKRITLLERYQRNPDYFDVNCGAIKGRRLCKNDKCISCFLRSFASSEKSDRWSKLNNFSPREVAISSHKEISFNCEKCGHTFQAKACYVSRGNWCKYCANQALCDDEECQTCFEKSFASTKYAKNWSNKNLLSARQVSKSSRKKMIYVCDVCNHEEIRTVGNVSNGDICRFCKGRSICMDNNCDMCFGRSFASHERSKYWSKENTLSPRECFKGSNEKYIFDCEKCGHEFRTALNEISYRDRWCPYCSGRKICGNNCKPCFNKSMASHWSIKYWSRDNISNPRLINRGSLHKCIFICEEGHKIIKTAKDVGYSNSWCPHCKNKTEKKLLESLRNLFSDVIPQQKFDWCRSTNANMMLSFDFYIPSLNMIVELDGIQHFEQVANWASPEFNQSRDIYKMDKCLEHGISVVRLLQSDVYYDRNNWKIVLLEQLYIREIPQVTFIAPDDEYENYTRYYEEKYMIDQLDNTHIN